MERPADRGRVDRRDDFEFDQLVRQESHRPPRPPGGRLGAGDGDEPGLLRAVQLAVLPAGRLLAVERGVQALGGELLADALDGHAGDVEGVGDAVVGPRVGAGRVGLQKDAGAGGHGGGALAGVGEALEGLAVGGGQGDGDLIPSCCDLIPSVVGEVAAGQPLAEQVMVTDRSN